MHFLDKPQPEKVETYHQAVDFLLNRIIKINGVVAVYQFGNITTPGISDIDLLVIFKDNIFLDFNAFDNYPLKFRKLFTHDLDAMALSFCKRTSRYASWNNIQCLWGQDGLLGHFETASEEEIRQLKIQIALEYLVTNYVDLTVQLTYDIIKLRAFFQHLKGLHYDLEYLGYNSGNIYEKIQILRGWIKDWFIKVPSEKEISNWAKCFYDEYFIFLKSVFSHYKLYVPKKDKYVYSRNITFHPGKDINYKHSGIILPALLSKFAKKKIYNLQHRFNNFKFNIPIQHQHNFKIIEERSVYFEELKKYNKIHFPNFGTLNTGFQV